MKVKIALCQMWMREVDSFKEFKSHVRYLLDQCHEADLVVFPEYTNLELITTAKNWERLPISNWPEVLKDFNSETEEFFWRESQMRSQVIVAGLIDVPHTRLAGRPTNRATIFRSPVAHHVKTKLIHREQKFGFEAGEDVYVFDIRFAKIGINLCYEVEFPEITRKLVKEGAEIIIVPAATFSQQGYHRVAKCAQARAIENQVYVAHCALGSGLDADKIRKGFPCAYAGSALYTPCDVYWSAADGILASCDGFEQVLIGTFDLDLLHECRESSSANTFKDSQ